MLCLKWLNSLIAERVSERAQSLLWATGCEPCLSLWGSSFPYSVSVGLGMNKTSTVISHACNQFLYVFRPLLYSSSAWASSKIEDFCLRSESLELFKHEIAETKDSWRHTNVPADSLWVLVTARPHASIPSSLSVLIPFYLEWHTALDFPEALIHSSLSWFPSTTFPMILTSSLSNLSHVWVVFTPRNAHKWALTCPRSGCILPRSRDACDNISRSGSSKFGGSSGLASPLSKILYVKTQYAPRNWTQNIRQAQRTCKPEVVYWYWVKYISKSEMLTNEK